MTIKFQFWHHGDLNKIFFISGKSFEIFNADFEQLG